ncbi:MAG: prepilin-type N-terminal cleavage/methylation domain-containing protein [Oceanicoccus sp.]|jgi:prepilin-type N-terminal cleavage/methylation domain-containing protein
MSTHFLFINNSFRTRHAAGFSLIELLTSLTVAAILLGIGIPNLLQWRQHSAQSSTLNTLNHLVSFARTRAILDNDFYTLCASADHINCNGEWNKTLIVFRDSNRNERVDGDEILFKALTLAAGTPCLRWQAGAGRNYLQFMPSGATNGTAGHFRFCEQVGNFSVNKVVVSFAGRTSIKNI